jgi:hypothetical protein
VKTEVDGGEGAKRAMGIREGVEGSLLIFGREHREDVLLLGELVSLLGGEGARVDHFVKAGDFLGNKVLHASISGEERVATRRGGGLK